jgi:hypothetical protein
MAYDAAGGEVILFGGLGGTFPNFQNQGDTWAWDGTNWLQKTPSTSPPGRQTHAMAYDGAHNQIVMFGGSSASTLRDTWVWDGTNWSEKFPSTSPPGRIRHAMVYDAAHNQVVLFGGGGPTGVGFAHALSDTWVWDGTSWIQKFPSTSPSARFGQAMTYDTVRGQVVMFGGADPSGQIVFSETWIWDGTNWTQEFPAHNPPARIDHTMVFDTVRSQAVMFGGFGYNGDLGDTWVWDGTDWTQEFPLASPSPRRFHAMAYDGARGQTMMFGGFVDVLGAPPLGDTWLWGVAGPLGEQAAARARSLVGNPYAEGAKGYDMATKNFNPPYPYVSAGGISSKYLHCTTTGCPPKVSANSPDATAPGIDCSGLVLWSYNTAGGATQTSSSDPIPRPRDEGAYDQYQNSAHFSDPGKLQPGDLLFFNYTNAKPVTHVAMRVLKVGNYFIKVVPKPDALASDTYSLTVTAGGSTTTLAESVPVSQIPVLGYGVESDGATIVPFIPVAVDIKPGDSSNPINPTSRGKISVAILSSTTFDALSQINVNSLTFGRTGTEPSLAFCNSGGEDVNGDGLPDLVCHFYTQKAEFQNGDTKGILKGLTVGGQLIRGVDAVRIVP